MNGPHRTMEREEISNHVARAYMAEYGARAIPRLEEAALLCEKNNDLPGRNRLLRLRDAILLQEEIG